jgi:hypothetical protein
MGILSDILVWLATKVRDLVTAILAAVTKVSNEVKIARLQIRDFIAQIVEVDILFLAYMVWSVGVTIMTAGFSAAVAAWWVESQIKLNLEAFITKLQLTNIALRLEQLQLLSEIAQLFLPQYRAIVQDVYKALAGISKIIYEETNDMSSWMLASRNVCYSAIVMMGGDPDTSEMLSYLAQDPWITKVNKRYRRYVENPYLIMEDLREEIIKPVLAPISAENQERLVRFENAYTWTQENVDNIRNLNDSIRQWIDVHPDDIKAEMDKRIGAVTVWVDGVLDVFEEKILTPVGESIALINERIEENNARMDRLLAQFPDLKNLIYDFYSLDPSDRQDAINMLRQLLDKELSYAKQAYREDLSNRYTDFKKDLFLRLGELIETEPTEFEVRDIAVRIPDVKYSTDSWFVGEY